MADEDHNMNEGQVPQPNIQLIDQANFHIQQLERELAVTRGQVEVLVANQNNPRLSTAKLNKPPEFHGRDRALAYDFIVQIENQFAGLHFTSEAQKIRFFHSFLRDEASRWFQPHANAANDPLANSWPAFRAAFLLQFGDPQRTETVATQLFRLRQVTSVSNYAGEFFRLATELDWNEEALMARFKDGLKPHVRTNLAINGTTFTNTKDLATLATTIDHATFINTPTFANKTYGNPPVLPTSRRTFSYQHVAPAAAAGGPTPMELDAQQVPRGPLTPQERLRRQQEGLCFYCAGKHIIAQCPLAKPRTARIQAIEGSSGEYQAQSSLQGDSA